MGNFLLIGDRLREERERLGMSQLEFCAIAEVTRKTLFGYETGVRAPDAGALASWAKRGLDVLYVVTGERSNVASTRHLAVGVAQAAEAEPLQANERLLLDYFRSLSEKKKTEVLVSMLAGGARRKPAKSGGISVEGDNNRTAGRDYHEKE